MAKLDTATTKSVNDLLKESKDVTLYNLPAFASTSNIIKYLTDIKNVLNKNKGKDVTIVLSVR